jgi:putative ABC transport system permease protein
VIRKIGGNYQKNEKIRQPLLNQMHMLKNLVKCSLRSFKRQRSYITINVLGLSLGLFGLTSFAIEQRTKEIGVRKAMGSSIAGIYSILSKEVIILILISTVIACPVIYYIAAKWLENFYYRINPGLFSFVAGLIIVLGIAILTINYHVLKAARINPARSLQYE